jgi:hypothetical protein
MDPPSKHWHVRAKVRARGRPALPLRNAEPPRSMLLGQLELCFRDA